MDEKMAQKRDQVEDNSPSKRLRLGLDGESLSIAPHQIAEYEKKESTTSQDDDGAVQSRTVAGGKRFCDSKEKSENMRTIVVKSDEAIVESTARNGLPVNVCSCSEREDGVTDDEVDEHCGKVLVVPGLSTLTDNEVVDKHCGKVLVVPGPSKESATRAKQQRLLILWHTTKCRARKCGDTPHCSTGKKIWAHIRNCSNPNCTEEYCVSSRYILSHYRHCKDSRCAVCWPVRRAIRESK